MRLWISFPFPEFSIPDLHSIGGYEGIPAQANISRLCQNWDISQKSELDLSAPFLASYISQRGRSPKITSNAAVGVISMQPVISKLTTLWRRASCDLAVTKVTLGHQTRAAYVSIDSTITL